LFRLNASEKYKSVIEEFNAIVMRPSLQNINLLRVIHFKYMLTHTKLVYNKRKFCWSDIRARVTAGVYGGT
ncbi:MAG: hypothetical protein ACI9BJ_000229, partial [Flavobacteriales bacterium]